MILSSLLLKVGKFILSTIAIQIGIVLATLGYTILRPIIKALGWLISIATFLLLVDWLL